MIKTATLVSSISRNGGGISSSVKPLVRAITAEGAAEVDVLGLEDEFSGRDSAGWIPQQPKVFPTLGPKSYGYSRGLRQALMDSDFELVHSHGLWMYPSRAVLLWWKKNRRPYLISPHGMLDPWAIRNSSFKKTIASRLYQQEHLLRAACLHSLCAAESQSLRDLGFKQPICQIPNGVDLPESRSTGPSPWTTRLNKKDRVLFYLGRLHPKKGLPALIEAFSRIQKMGGHAARNWYLAIAGWDQDGHEDHLKRLVQAGGMENRVFFMGPLFDRAKANAFQGSSAFVLPSHSEGLPIAVLEAWSYSLPVLMTPECNLPEGFVVGAAHKISTDTASLEHALEDFFNSDPDRLKSMGRRGRSLVEKKFTWEKIGKNMNAVYLWLLKRGPMPACVLQ